MNSHFYGQRPPAAAADGTPLRAGVFNEHQVRAAAGLTLAAGAVAFAYAALARVYGPIRWTTALFLVEFGCRVAVGVHRSPLGVLAGWMVRRVRPQWVSARPKRFPWTLGLVMSAAMTAITNLGIRGPLPLSICGVCLALMWTETALGLCLGCEIHAALRRRGWVAPDGAIELCAGAVCATPAPPERRSSR